MFPFLSLLMIASIVAFPVLAGSAPETESEIQRRHDEARIPKESTWIVEEFVKPEFLKRFAEQNCGFSPGDPERPPIAEEKKRCDRQIKSAIFAEFSRRYFAADRGAVSAKCKKEEFLCMDPKILEGWMRDSHNQGIEASRKEKLDRLRNASSVAPPPGSSG